MRVAPGAARSLLVTGTILVAAHATLLVCDPRANLLSNLFILRMHLLGVTLCLLGAFTETSETSPLWLLLGSGFLLAAVGQIGSMNYDLALHIHVQTQALNPDF
jgi:hypothetical protein